MALPFFNRFPYTNIGDINLDWIIKQVKILTKRVEELDPEDITERLNQVEAEAAQASVDAASAAGSASDAAASAASAVTAVNNLPSDALPIVNGTASAGSNAKLSRADHVHPHDTASDGVRIWATGFNAVPYRYPTADDQFDNRITSDMRVTRVYFGVPNVVRTRLTIEVNDGYIRVTDGFVSGSTAMEIILQKVVL